MTKSQDKMAIDAANAANLIKSTAESTATALNIQYMQKDIGEIKTDIKTLVATQDGKVEELQNKIDGLQRTVAIGIGIASTIAFAFPILIKFLVK